MRSVSLILAAAASAALFAAVSAEDLRPVRDPATVAADSRVAGVIPWDGKRAFFLVDVGTSLPNRSLWITDGTTSGTMELIGIDYDVADPKPPFATRDGVAYLHLERYYRTDGTPEGTAITNFPGSDSPPVLLGDWFFGGYSLSADNVCFDTLGTEVELARRGLDDGPVERIVDIFPGCGQWCFWSTPPFGPPSWNCVRFTASSFPRDLFFYGGEFYFRAVTELGEELWASDGTAENTRLAGELWPGPNSGIPGPAAFASAGGHLFFRAHNGVTETLGILPEPGEPPHEIDAVSALAPESIDPWIFPFGGSVLFAARGGGESFLYRTDGTTTGTVLLVAVPETDAVDAEVGAPLRIGDLAYFTLFHPDFGQELWRTDGTAAGTRLVADLLPGVGSSAPAGLSSTGGGELYFAAWTSGHGDEPWRIRAGATLPEPVAEVQPGEADGTTGPFVRIGSEILFPGDNGIDEPSLFAIEAPLSAPSGFILR